MNCVGGEWGEVRELGCGLHLMQMRELGTMVCGMVCGAGMTIGVQ